MSKSKTTKARAKVAAAPPPDESEYLKLGNQLCFPLYAASRMMTNAYRPLLDSLGLTYPQYLVLLVLWETDGLSVSEIGDRLYLDSGTLTPLLKRLEQQGIVARRRREQDDRVVGNWLTAEGKALRKRAVHIPGQMLCNAKLELEDVMSMKLVLDRLIAALLPLQGGEAA